MASCNKSLVNIAIHATFAMASTLTLITIYYRESRLLNLRERQSTRLAHETPEER